MVCAMVGTEDLVSVAPELCAFDSVGAMRAHYPCYMASLLPGIHKQSMYNSNGFCTG